jgi:hypothetical protein
MLCLVFGIFTAWVMKNSKNWLVLDVKYDNHKPTDRNDNEAYIRTLILNEQTKVVKPAHMLASIS